jgi:hypothetical protein
MSAGDLAIVVATVLCAIGFAALIVVLLRVLDTLKHLRGEVQSLKAETQPLLAQLRTSVDEARTSVDEARTSVDEARDDLERFDRVLGSAEAISDAMSGTGRVARVAFSTPVIKTVALATGTGRAARRLRNGAASANTPPAPALEQASGRRSRKQRSRG